SVRGRCNCSRCALAPEGFDPVEALAAERAGFFRLEVRDAKVGRRVAAEKERPEREWPPAASRPQVPRRVAEDDEMAPGVQCQVAELGGDAVMVQLLAS